ncbi:GATA zinc finger protein [Hirschfeldia incana]|nr:GATA zinc finger protein [Hirschfeldia incana]
MSEPNRAPESTTRPVGGTEYSWCRAIAGGTGIAVIALSLTRTPKLENLQNTLNKLQIRHPTLRSTFRFDASTDSFSLATSAADSSRVVIHPFDSSSTAQIIRDSDDPPHRIILEHELNKNTWIDPHRWINGECGVFFVSLYDLDEGGEERVLTFRLNTGACDRTSAVTLLREFMRETTTGGGCEEGHVEELGKAIEEMVPSGKGDKPFWARGIDVLGYSLNAFRFSNLGFVDAEDSNRRSQVVRMKLERDQTLKLVAGCKARGIKLWAAIAAAGMISAYSSKNLPQYQGEKYAVVTLSDCRPILEPPLTPNDFGFYHSGILHTHDITGEEKLWDLAKRCYESFTSAKNSNKHFTDMSDLNFLMCKAIENPSLTPSSSLRTALISIFEDPVTDEYSEQALASAGVKDYIGCASIHGVGPSVAVFDSLRDGKLDCSFVYPSPLHSREQMDELIEHVKTILLEGSVSSF